MSVTSFKHFKFTLFVMSSLSYTQRLFQRYQQIDEVIIDTSLWSIFTQEMIARYNDEQLKAMGSGQTSKLNKLHRIVTEVFADEIYTLDGINQRIDDDNTDVKLSVVKNESVNDIRNYVNKVIF